MLYLASSSDFSVSENDASFTAAEYAERGTIQVYACINGSQEPDGPETIGVTVIEPTGAGLVKKIGSGVWHVQNTASVGFRGICFLTPDDVSFSAVEVRERTCPMEATGYYSQFKSPHPDGSWEQCNHNINTNSNKRNVWANDTIVGYGPKRPFSNGTYVWNIPWEFRCGTHTKQFIIMTHHVTINPSGNITLSKGSITVSAKFSDPTSSF